MSRKSGINDLMLLLVSILLIGRIKSECNCKLRSLKDLESLEKSWRRLRLENPNGLTKYPMNNENLVVGCQTLAVYEKLIATSTKKIQILR